MRQQFIRSVGLLVGLAVIAPAAVLAQSFQPARQVHLIVPFPPGGATDGLARLMADKLSERWKQSVIVENRPGANTTLGTDAVAKSAPDGLTLGMVTGSHIINPLLTDKLPYDTLKELAPVMMLTRMQMGLFAYPAFPANTPTELLDMAKKENVAYASATTQSYLGMELLASLAGVKFDYIPYKGSAQANTDLIGGHVKLMIDPVIPTAMEYVRTGKMKLIGTMGAKPSQLAPGTPTFGSIVKGYDFEATFGLIARGGTPPALLRKIRDDFAEVMKLPEVVERIRITGQEAIASTPEEYGAYIVSEMNTWRPVVKSTGAKLD